MPGRTVVVERLAVDRDPLAHPLHVGRGEAAGAQLEATQQRVDHARGGGLAVGAGQVDYGVGALRFAEQVGEGADPVQRRLQPRLRPAGQQGILDLGEGLGEAWGGNLGIASSVQGPLRQDDSPRPLRPGTDCTSKTSTASPPVVSRLAVGSRSQPAERDLDSTVSGGRLAQRHHVVHEPEITCDRLRNSDGTRRRHRGAGRSPANSS